MNPDTAALQAMGRIAGELLVSDTWVHGARNLAHPDRRDARPATPTAAALQREAHPHPHHCQRDTPCQPLQTP